MRHAKSYGATVANRTSSTSVGGTYPDPSRTRAISGEGLAALRAIFCHRPPPREYPLRHCRMPSCAAVGDRVGQDGLCDVHRVENAGGGDGL